jgi:hypothetical protein
MQDLMIIGHAEPVDEFTLLHHRTPVTPLWTAIHQTGKTNITRLLVSLQFLLGRLTP